MYEPQGWVIDETQYRVNEAYQDAFNNWSRHKFGSVEIDGDETESIEKGEAHGFYYLVISVNDTPKKRIRLYRNKPNIEMEVVPESEAGYRHILDILSSALDFVRGLLEL